MLVVPFTRETEYIKAYKQARRKDDDIAIVNAGLSVILCQNNGQWIVEAARFSYGGMGPTTVCAKQSANMITGKPWEPSLVTDRVCQQLLQDMPMPLSTPGGQVEFRKSCMRCRFNLLQWLKVLCKNSLFMFQKRFRFIPRR